MRLIVSGWAVQQVAVNSGLSCLYRQRGTNAESCQGRMIDQFHHLYHYHHHHRHHRQQQQQRRLYRCWPAVGSELQSLTASGWAERPPWGSVAHHPSHLQSDWKLSSSVRMCSVPPTCNTWVHQTYAVKNCTEKPVIMLAPRQTVQWQNTED